METKAFTGQALYVHFQKKGWIAKRSQYHRFVEFYPPFKFKNAHRVCVAMPVTEPMGFTLDCSKPFYANIYSGRYKDGEARGNKSVNFEICVKESSQQWMQFAHWVNALIENPDKFYEAE